MRSRGFFLAFVFAIFLLLEWYTYNGLKSLTTDKSIQRWFTIGYVFQSLVVVCSFYMVYSGMQTGALVRSSSVNLAIGIVFTSFVTKLIFCSIMIMQDGGRGIVGLINYTMSLFGESSSDSYVPSRRKVITTGATLLAAIPFTTLLYGITKGKYRFTVKDIILRFKDLPSSFDGLNIVQISDIHSGSFDSVEDVMEGIKMINECNPDVVLFTGDLVNSDKDEINPYIDAFSQINAKYGKYAVLGNHDYYGIRADKGSEEYKAYFDDFFKKYKKMGFQLLNNDNDRINIDGEEVVIAGVENWGSGRYFQKYGDIDKALSTVEDDAFTILLSHDPTHWDEKVIPNKKKVHLTLSGHTHGMQFGIDIPWLKWSPVQYRYKRWSGLYSKADEHLYVNRGFGFLGFPGRVGMWPEITSIKLHTA